MGLGLNLCCGTWTVEHSTLTSMKVALLSFTPFQRKTASGDRRITGFARPRPFSEKGAQMGELCLNPFSGRVLAGDHSALLGQSSETSRHRRQRERLGHDLSLCRDYGKVGGLKW